MSERKEKKFSLVDYVLVTMLVVPLDILEVLLEPTFLTIILWPFEIVISGIMILWFWLKGAEWKVVTGGRALELVPFLGWFLIGTATAWWAMWRTNNPKVLGSKKPGLFRRAMRGLRRKPKVA